MATVFWTEKSHAGMDWRTADSQWECRAYPIGVPDYTPYLGLPERGYPIGAPKHTPPVVGPLMYLYQLHLNCKHLW